MDVPGAASGAVARPHRERYRLQIPPEERRLACGRPVSALQRLGDPARGGGRGHHPVQVHPAGGAAGYGGGLLYRKPAG